jgi:hypothetical protein
MTLTQKVKSYKKYIDEITALKKAGVNPGIKTYKEWRKNNGKKIS